MFRARTICLLWLLLIFNLTIINDCLALNDLGEK